MHMLEALLYVLYAVLLGMFGLAVWRLRYASTHFTMKPPAKSHVTLDSLPSVTVCIPVRNETHVMTDALQRVIASTYPKLEIIVLDDLSGDNTPALVKAFAQEGVRFVEGEKLPAGWLGKNHALQGLLDQASGTYVLFMDVDTRLAPDSIQQLVSYAQQEKAAMVSVLPRRNDAPRASVFFSPLRYFWEIMFHRKSAPATTSNAWMIHRKTLLDTFKGFHELRAVIQPESHIAAALMATQQYRFLIGTDQLGVSYEKKWRSQLSTSVRLLFPLLGSKITHAVIAALDLIVAASPVFILISSLFLGWTVHHFIALAIFCLYGALYATYLRMVWQRGWIVGGLLWALIVVQEAILVIVSAIRYGRKLVTWKGRRVTAL